MTRYSMILLAASICLSVPLSACEPVLPFMYVVGGPGVITKSIAVLALAVAVKSILFALFQKKLSFARGVLFMLNGNVVSSLVGVLAAGLVGASPFMWLFGIPIAYVLCLLPAVRATRFIDHSSYFIALIMTIALVGSCALFMTIQGNASRGELVTFWSVKIVAVYLALSVSIALSTFWEEWVIWKLANVEEHETCFIQPALKANLCVLVCVMIYAATLMIPIRRQYDNYLVPSAIRL